jgi:hypothetical protein
MNQTGWIEGWQGPLLAACLCGLLDGFLSQGGIGCNQWQGPHDTFPAHTPGSDTVTFGQLGQGQIKSGLRFGSVASAGTKAGVSRVRAVHRNQQQAVAALTIERVFNSLKKVVVLQCQRGQITATYPDYRSSTGHDGGFMKAQAAIGLQLRAPECFLRGKRQRFYCLRAVGPAEAAWGITLLQSIMPGCLLLGNPSRQLINVLCWSEQNSAIAQLWRKDFKTLL